MAHLDQACRFSNDQPFQRPPNKFLSMSFRCFIGVYVVYVNRLAWNLKFARTTRCASRRTRLPKAEGGPQRCSVLGASELLIHSDRDAGFKPAKFVSHEKEDKQITEQAGNKQVQDLKVI